MKGALKLRFCPLTRGLWGFRGFKMQNLAKFKNFYVKFYGKFAEFYAQIKAFVWAFDCR